MTRWQKYGKDRLYVSDAQGGKLGWHDLLTGETHADGPAAVPAVEQAVRRWLAEHPTKAPAGSAPPPPLLPPPPSPRPSAPPPLSGFLPPVVVSALAEDLATRRAGTEARRQALALRAEAPLRTFVTRVLGVKTEERAWRIGADGEIAVGDQIARLTKGDPRWHCLHAVPVGDRGSDIDHVLVGPAGVFTLNTKHHPDGRMVVQGDRTFVNGQHRPYVRNSRHEAKRAADRLSKAFGAPVPVRGLIVPVGVQLVVKEQPADVRVVGRRDLVSWLRNQAPLLEASAVAAIFALARRPDVWRPAGQR